MAGAGRLDQGAGREEDRRHRRAQPASGQLQRPIPRHAVAGRVAPAPLLAARPAGLDPLPHAVFQVGLGLLPDRPPAAVAPAGQLRSVRGHRPGAGLAHLRGVCAARRERRGSARLHPRLPPLAGQRQPVGHLDRHLAGQDAGRTAQAPLHLSLRVHSGHHRRHCLAVAAAGRDEARGAWRGHLRRGRCRRLPLQAQPPGRRRDRPHHGAGAGRKPRKAPPAALHALRL